jgi:chromosome segregation ATPase
MAIDDLLISTGVDSLIKLVREKGKIELNSAAKALSLTPQNVQDWAAVLEQEGIITIEYKLTKAYLVWIEPEPKKLEARAAQITERKSEVAEQIHSLEQRVEEQSGDLESLQTEYSGMLGDVEDRLHALHEKLSALEDMDAKTQNLFNSEAARLATLRKEFSELEARLSGSIERSKGAKGPSTSGITIEREQISDLARFRDDIQDLIAQSESVYSDIEAKVSAAEEEAKSGYMQKADALQSKLDSLIEKVEKMEAQIEALAQEQEIIAEDTEKISEELSSAQSPKIVSDAIEESLAQLRELHAAAKEEKKKLERELGANAATVSKLLAKFESAYKAQQVSKPAVGAKGVTDSDLQRLSQIRSEISESLRKLTEYASELESYAGPLHEEIRAEIDSGKQVLSRLSQAKGKQDEIRKVMEATEQLRARQQELSLKLRAIEGEAAIVNLESQGPQVQAIEQRVQLTTDEEKDFEQKREELRGLIRKMWEEDKK